MVGRSKKQRRRNRGQKRKAEESEPASLASQPGESKPASLASQAGESKPTSLASQAGESKPASLPSLLGPGPRSLPASLASQAGESKPASLPSLLGPFPGSLPASLGSRLGPLPGSLHSNPNYSLGVSMQSPLSRPVPKEPGLDPSQYPPMMPIEKIVSSILKNPPRMGVENALNELRLAVSVPFVEDVLKLSYGAGMEAFKFFRWAGLKLGRNRSPLAWNLLVDLLGKEKLFHVMWDCIKLMKTEGIVSMDTISCVFDNYVQADKVGEARLTFDVMEQYGCRQDVVALNCLISAFCRYKQAKAALEFFDAMKQRITPDADTYAMLLEGWENEDNVVNARATFEEMIIRIGWLPNNTSAYNAFLSTLVNCFEVEEALKFLNVMKSKKCLPDLGFFRKALQVLYQRKNRKDAHGLWELMMQNGIVPDGPTYNTMIGVFCSANPSQVDSACRLLDEMVFNGAFPDFKAYNTIFEALITAHKVEEASSIFREMTKNECCPLYDNYVMAIKMYFKADDPEMAVMMWRHMIQKAITPKSDCVAILIDGFCRLGRETEALKYIVEAINRGVELPVETKTMLKDALIEAGEYDAYKIFEQKLKSTSSQRK